jgi:hypothetical protein
VPQIDAVGDAAQIGDAVVGQQSPQAAVGGGVGRPGDEGDGRKAGEHGAAEEVRRVGPARRAQQGHRQDQGAEAEDHELLGVAPDQLPDPGTQRRCREHRPQKRLEDLGVGAHVGPIGPGRDVQLGHQHRRHDRQDATRDHDGGRAAIAGAHAIVAGVPPRAHSRKQQRDGLQHQRPDEVELLLDAERPQVQQWRGGPVEGEVAAGRDEAPVANVEQTPQQVSAEAGPAEHRGRGQGPHADDEEDQQRGRHEAGHPAGPEAGEVDPAVRHDVAQQQGGDEEAGQNEEDVDAEEAARHPRDPEVEEDDQRHREGPDAVQGVDAFRRLRRRVVGASQEPRGVARVARGALSGGRRRERHERNSARATSVLVPNPVPPLPV